MWKGGKYTDKDGYIRILQPGHPAATQIGYVLEHRLVMERKIGRFLRSTEVVHHINGIRNDNRIENLELMGKSEHDSRTGKERKYPSTSGFRGVSFDSSRRKWQAYIDILGKRKSLGRFSIRRKAVSARKMAEESLTV